MNGEAGTGGASAPIRVLSYAPELDGTALSRAVRERTAGAGGAAVTDAPPPDTSTLAAALQAHGNLESYAVTVLSAAFGAPDRDDGEHGSDRFFHDAVAAIDAVKRAGGRVLVVNASTVVPEPRSPERRARSLAIARRNVECIRLSVATGISVIDVDRIIAELGGDEHVVAACSYSSAARDAIADETARVLVDYGFFDERPVLEQIGRGVPA